MRDYFCIGPTPSNEDCAQVGQPNYREKALEECARFIRLLREKIGPEPEGAWLSVKWFEHDFGPYCEVVCYCNSDIPESVEYAQRCEDDAPRTWNEEGDTS
jgi:hypothetical protein